MRLWIGLLAWLPFSLLGQNQSTQFLNLTIAFDATGVTLSAFQQNDYATYTNNVPKIIYYPNTAYILIPKVSKTVTYAQAASAKSISLPFNIDVLPIQTSAESFQLQGSVLPQRFNLLGFISPFYYQPQFYPPAVQGFGNPIYAYASLTTSGNALKIWNQGQTTIGSGTNLSTQTVGLLVTPSYSTPNLLQSVKGTTTRSSVSLTLTLTEDAITSMMQTTSTGSQAVPTGVYFFQVYLTLNPYQALTNSMLSAYLNNTLDLLTTLQAQSTSFGNQTNTSLTAAQYKQLVTNQTFLQSEITQVNKVIATLN
ncbi:MAG: hypothetical protein ACOYK9_04270 [Chlamydiia bacterium]